MAFITVVESVYCAVRTDSLYKADYVSSLKGQYYHPSNCYTSVWSLFCRIFDSLIYIIFIPSFHAACPTYHITPDNCVILFILSLLLCILETCVPGNLVLIYHQCSSLKIKYHVSYLREAKLAKLTNIFARHFS